MSWRDSLVRLAEHDVETLRKRLAEILDRRAMVEGRAAALGAQVAAERAKAASDAAVAFLLPAFLNGAKLRQAAIVADFHAISSEEAGARDALAQAFEALKKFEHVAETARIAMAKTAAGVEARLMDEIGLRKRAG
jgi:hypothetical protein